MDRRTSFGIFAILALNAVLPGFHHDLWNPDEPRLAHIAQSMVRDGDWVLPRVNGEPFIEQPPLQAWLVALCFAAFGSGFDRDAVARLPSMALALALLALVYRLGARHFGRRAGLLAAVLLATTVEFHVGYQRAIVDVSLAFFVAAAMAQLAEAAAGEGVSLSWRRALVLGIAAGASFLAKNLIGVVFIGLAWATLAMMQPRRWFTAAALARAALAALAAAVVVSPWLGLLWQRHPHLLDELLLENTLGRFARSDIHNPPFFEFLHRAAGVLLPWLPLAALRFAGLLRELARCRRAGLSPPPARRVEGLLLAWALLPGLLILFSGSKREIYLLPLTPAVALAAAAWLDAHLAARGTAIALRVLDALLWLAVPALALVGGIWAGPLPAAFWAYLVLHLAVLYRRWRGRARPGAEARLAPALALLLIALGAGSLVFYIARNPEESYAELARDLAALRSKGFEVAGVDLPLRELSAIPYYLGGAIPNLRSPEAVAARFADGAPPAVLVLRSQVRERFLPPDRVHYELREYHVRRGIALIANRPPDGAPGAEAPEEGGEAR
jgi:4-amino-4-deoxy-L-arabinose transferase-like glycosyltransferase